MATCFIFTRQFDEEQCLCLRLDQQGQIEEPLALRPIHEVRLLQIDATTIVVLPTESSSLHEVELPLLSERKARSAIPYALEEQLAQNVTTLHFSFDRQHFQNNRYLVVVTDKQFLLDLVDKLRVLQLHFDAITLDWFALNPNEACVMEQGLLIHDMMFRGALNGEIAEIYLNNKERKAPLLMFKDSPSSPKMTNVTPIDNLAYVWIAQRLLQLNFINLCQDELRQDSRKNVKRSWYKACGVLLGLLISSVMIMKVIFLHSVSSKMADIDKQTEVIYRDFFPDAKQVISPRFRITQLLTTGLSNGDTAVLWSLLDKLSHSYDGKVFTIEQFRFQNRVLSVTLVGNDFAALENLQQHLQQDKVKVMQSQASSRDHKAVATLELTL